MMIIRWYASHRPRNIFTKPGHCWGISSLHYHSHHSFPWITIGISQETIREITGNHRKFTSHGMERGTGSVFNFPQQKTKDRPKDLSRLLGHFLIQGSSRAGSPKSSMKEFSVISRTWGNYPYFGKPNMYIYIYIHIYIYTYVSGFVWKWDTTESHGFSLLLFPSYSRFMGIPPSQTHPCRYTDCLRRSLHKSCWPVLNGDVSLATAVRNRLPLFSRLDWWMYPPVICYIAIEDDHLLWIFPLKMMDLSTVLLVITRGYLEIPLIPWRHRFQATFHTEMAQGYCKNGSDKVVWWCP